jgi:predicted phage terminase large subunit-like protein
MSEEDVDINDFKSVEAWLEEVNYSDDEKYVPSEFALEFVTFIKLVEDGNPENKTPVVHYKMVDNFVAEGNQDTINMCHRGIAKSTLKEYLILYIGVFGMIPGFGKVPYAIYVSDSIENGVKKMRKALEYRWQNSEFLQEVIPSTRFTDVRWEFINKEGNSLVVSGYGAKTGVRGTRENNSRPVLALLDDLISDSDARSATVIADVEDTVYKAVDYALHPKIRKIIWSGTPFNAKDPLYKAVESGAWKVNVYPVCEQFPCSREEFRGSWEDRFDYDYVKRQYDKAYKAGKIDTFNQELMLKIMSDEDRLIQDCDIRWYKRDLILKNKGLFNFYITTDLTTSEKTSADYAVISVWAYNNAGQWFWVDGIVKKQSMNNSIDDLFRLAQQYKPQGVGIEVSGQQEGFIPWIQEQMMVRNNYFTLTSSGNSNNPGVRPVTNKFARFDTVTPWFAMGLMHFPEERRNSIEMKEAMNEITLAARGGFKSKHDDFLDTISMLSVMKAWKPSQEAVMSKSGSPSDIWELDDDGDSYNDLDSYIV